MPKPFLDELKDSITREVVDVEHDNIEEFADDLLKAVAEAFDDAGDELEEENHHPEAKEARETADEIRACVEQ